MTDWIDSLIPAAIGLLLLLGGASALRSNAHERVVWKFPVGWFSIVLGGAAIVYAATVFPTDAFRNNIAARSTTSETTMVVTTSSTPTTLLATTTLSYFATPSEASARQWAEDAISYAEGNDWRWNNRDEAIQFYASYGSRQCGYLAGELAFLPSNPGGGLPLPPNPPRRSPGGFPPAAPSQIEANLRAQLGIEAWEAYGMAWFDSLVRGLCVRG